jgi:hypothetical protein
MANQNGIINGNGQNGAPQNQPKTGLKGLLQKAHRKYDEIRYSKAGKWIMRGLTVATIGGTAKVAYDKGLAKGKASVVPTVVTIEKIPDETETPAEAVEVEETTV